MKSEAFAPVPAGSISENPVASGWLNGRAARCFLTSTFLIRLTAAPVVLLLA